MAQRPSFSRDLTWRLELLLFDIVRSIARLFPLAWVSAAGGWVFSRLGRYTRSARIAARNIELAFPEWTSQQRADLLQAQWDNLGRTFFEFPFSDRLTPSGGRIEMVHAERLEAIRLSGKPVVFVSGHFANWELMAAAIVDSGVPCAITYRAANNPHIERRFAQIRARYGVKLFAPKGADGSRELLKSLNEGQSIALMNDQKFNSGIGAPFFGRTVHSAGAPTRMALRFDAPLQPMWVQRLPGARFRIVVDDPIPLVKTGDRDRDVQAGVAAINAYVEAKIRLRPAEWFWVHKRWPQEDYEGI